ncbi:MAG: BLUF domain-containing protein [Oligoflexus sp.]
MTKYIFQLSYMSRAKFQFTEKDLEEMLEQARQFNLSVGITGILLYNKGVFLQMLEGEEVNVRQLYGRIEQDVRHEQVHNFFENYTPMRMFENWSMAYQNISLYEPDLVRRLHELVHQFHQTDIIATRQEWMSILQAMRHEL